jgi:succinate dehydrogenase assembly factor 1
MRLSGLQREVLSLYRKCLRESRKKPMVSVRKYYQSSFSNSAERENSLRILYKVSQSSIDLSKSPTYGNLLDSKLT